jgi:serine/threonine protein kinase
MHSKNYVHHDIKTSNMLISSDFKVKLACLNPPMD